MSAVPAPGHPVTADTRPSFIAWGPAMAVLGLIGLVASILFMIAPDSRGYMLNSWVLGFIFWILISLGCLGLNLLYYSVKGSWISAILRLTEAGGGARMFLVFLGLLIPIFLGMPSIYEWVGATAADPILLSTLR